MPDMIRKEIPLGATYLVDLDSIRRMPYTDLRTGTIVYPLAVYCVDDATNSFGWFQVQLLDIDEGLYTAEEAA
jgi:hypothetical protein